jgi:predicted transcriptional regulator
MAKEDPSSDLDSDLRAARCQLGISRAKLAGLAGVSISALGDIEGGYMPRRSRVLESAWAAIREVEQQAGRAA